MDYCLQHFFYVIFLKFIEKHIDFLTYTLYNKLSLQINYINELNFAVVKRWVVNSFEFTVSIDVLLNGCLYSKFYF